MRFYKEQNQFYIVIGVECIFTWYWIADFYSDRSIPSLLRTIPGIGEILSLVILYEIEDIHRFPDVCNFISYCRLVKCAHESAGKKTGGGHDKIGNVHLKWAFSLERSGDSLAVDWTIMSVLFYSCRDT